MPSTLLCVDSDRNYCELLARTLRGEGYAVRVAHDGEEALRCARDTEPDLVLMDVLLPRRDGFAVLEELRANGDAGRRLPVLLLSGCSVTDTYRTRAARLEASALITKPVPLERLLGLIAKLLQRGAPAQPAAPAPARATRRPPGTARLEGTLQEVPFGSLLHHLHGLRASGVLHVQSGKKKKKVQLSDGHPVAVKSNLVGETLGQLLVATGKISRDVLHDSVLRVKRGEGLQGQILVAMHMLDESDLAHALRQQAEEKLLEIFAWNGGSFRFQRGVRLRGGNTLSLKGSPANLVARGVMLRVSPDLIDGFFKDWGDARVAPASRPFYAFQEIDLDEAAEELLARIDGQGVLSDLLPLDNRSRRLLYAWHAVELIELHRTDAWDATRPAMLFREAPAARPVGKVRPLPTAVGEAAEGAEGGEAEVSEEDGIRAELVGMAERLRQRDAFGVLGVARDTSDNDIRDAYFGLAKRTHPDRFSGSSEAVRRVAEEVFGLISKAWEEVGTREQRAAYVRAEREAEENRAAVEEGQRAVKAEFAFQRGRTLIKAKSYAEAVERFREAVELFDEEGEYHAYLGWALYLEDPKAPGRSREARAMIVRGGKLAPESEKPYLFLGRIYRAEGAEDRAERMFQQVIRLDPDCVDAIRELRLIDMRRQKSRGLVRRLFRR